MGNVAAADQRVWECQMLKREDVPVTGGVFWITNLKPFSSDKFCLLPTWNQVCLRHAVIYSTSLP